MTIEFLCASDAAVADYASETAEEFYSARRPDLKAQDFAAISTWLAWKSGQSGELAKKAGLEGDTELSAELKEWRNVLFQAALLTREFSKSKEL